LSIYLYYYINQLRIRGSIFCHGIFLLYPFYSSIRQIISIFGWSNVCNRVHWSLLSLHFFSIYTIISIYAHDLQIRILNIFLFMLWYKNLIYCLRYALWLTILYIFDKKLMAIIYVGVIHFSYHKHHESLTHIVQKIQSKIKYVFFIIGFLYNLMNL
jgi:hypothetical protein